MPKKDNALVSLGEAFARHTARHTARLFNVCTSVPCSALSRENRTKYLEEQVRIASESSATAQLTAYLKEGGKSYDIVVVSWAEEWHTSRSHPKEFFDCGYLPCCNFTRDTRLRYVEDGIENDPNEERYRREFITNKPQAIDEVLAAAARTGELRLDPREELADLVRNGASTVSSNEHVVRIQNFEPLEPEAPRIQIAVYYLDDTTRWYPVPVGQGWQIDNVNRQIIVGRGVPRMHIPLDVVRAFNVEPYGSNGYSEE